MKLYTTLKEITGWEKEVLFYLLEKPRLPNEIMLFRFPEIKRETRTKRELYKNKSQYLFKKNFGCIWRLNINKLLKKREKPKSSKESYEIDWNTFFKLFENDLSKLGMLKHYHDIKELKTFILKNREFIFKEEFFKIMYKTKEGWGKLPSLMGIVNIGLFNLFFCIAFKQGFSEKIIVENDKLITNIGSILEFNHSDKSDKFQARIEELIKKLAEKYNKKYATEIFSHHLIKDYFKFLSFDYSQSNSPDLLYSILNEGLITHLTDENIKQMETERTKRNELKKEEGLLPDEYLIYNINFPRVLKELKSIEKLAELFR